MMTAASENDRSLAPDEITRYSRELLVSGVSADSLLKLRRTLVLLDDALAHAAPYLVGAGFGGLRIVSTDPASVRRFTPLRDRLVRLDARTLTGEPIVVGTRRGDDDLTTLAAECPHAVLFVQAGSQTSAVLLPVTCFERLTVAQIRIDNRVLTLDIDGMTVRHVDLPPHLDEHDLPFIRPAPSDRLILSVTASALLLDVLLR